MDVICILRDTCLESRDFFSGHSWWWETLLASGEYSRVQGWCLAPYNMQDSSLRQLFSQHAGGAEVQKPAVTVHETVVCWAQDRSMAGLNQPWLSHSFPPWPRAFLNLGKSAERFLGKLDFFNWKTLVKIMPGKGYPKCIEVNSSGLLQSQTYKSQHDAWCWENHFGSETSYKSQHSEDTERTRRAQIRLTPGITVLKLFVKIFLMDSSNQHFMWDFIRQSQTSHRCP